MSNTKISVLHIITKLELGGAQQNTLYTVENLDRKRFIASLIAGPGGMLNDDAANIDGVRFSIAPHLIRSINPFNDWKGYRELRKMIRDLKPRIVHTHSSKAGILGRLAAAAERVPIIIHSIHGFGIDAVKNKTLRRILLAAERSAAKRTTHFIAVSNQNIEAGRKWGLLDKNNVSLIYSGIRLNRFRDAACPPQLATELGIEPETLLVGKIACFKPQKNPLAFVDMAAMVHARMPAVKFLLVGDGALRRPLEIHIKELGLKDSVILTGWRSDVPELLKLMNVSVLTSRWEGLPRVIPQSLAAGVPVAVMRAGGSAEAVCEGETGFVVEQGDIRGLAEKVLQLLRNPELAERMGKNGPESVKEWDIDRMVRAQEDLYSAMLEKTCVADNAKIR